MSAEARPISPASFAKAIEDLPVENLYSKAFEINNSVAYLERSNKLLQEYSDSIKNDESVDALTRVHGDKDCLEAIKENEVVIERQLERVRLLKAEVERRGQRWHEANPKETEDVTNSDNHYAGNGQASTTSANTPAPPAPPAPTHLSDDELRRQLEAQLAEDGEEDGGLQL